MRSTHPSLDRRRAGVLLHLTSLPGPHGLGDLGRPASRFMQWLAASGWDLWQMLPTGPIGKGDSPYSSGSSFAIEPLLVSLEGLVDEGLLARGALRAPTSLKRCLRADYACLYGEQCLLLPKSHLYQQFFHSSYGGKYYFFCKNPLSMCEFDSC